MSAQRRENEELEISLSADFVHKLEHETGFRMDELDGVRVHIVGDPPRMVFRAVFAQPGEEADVILNRELFDDFFSDEGELEGPDTGTECNGKDNKWQDQSACGNLIKKC